jgi:hypothetical protein
MSNPASTSASPGWYDDGTGRQRYWDGTQWTIYAPAQNPPQPTPVAVVSQPKGRQANNMNVSYVRQQKGHSFLLHWFVLGYFTLWIVPIYYSVSPNHYWHI